MAPTFRDAVAALDAGDADALAAMLAAEPALARARARDDDGPAGVYDGYFHRATLLHHVAGNPVRGPLPENVVALATVLLDHGADVDATCGGGPRQPASGGGTTLGLVMSGRQAAESPAGPALVDLLLARGARAGLDDGGLLWLALYHAVECRRQGELAAHLRRHGAAVDLCLAAGLGELDVVRARVRDDGRPREDAAALWRTRRRSPPDPAEVAIEALACAAANGRDAVVGWLLDRGAAASGWTTFGPWRVTPLHAAAWAGWPATCRLLLERGADAAARDPSHDATPLEWAEHLKRDACVRVLRPGAAAGA